jgi:hypothetical protein
MSRTARQVVAGGFALLLCTLALSAQDKPITTSLKFKPQEGVSKNAPLLPDGFKDKSVAIKVVDGRKVKTPGTIGEGTGDEDRVFPILTEDDVVRYATDVLIQVAEQWGMNTRGNPADRILTVKLANFYVTESNKAVGSMYSGDVTVNYSLADSRGKTLASGTVSGDSKRYGRARSRDNYSEVLSDAMKAAYSSMFDDQPLQDAWMSGKSSGSSRPIEAAGSKSSAPCDDLTPEQRMKRLDDMLKKGMITKDEYNSKRAEIVKML